MAQSKKKGPAPKQKGSAPKQAGTQIALRVDDDLLALIDAEAERLEAERPGLSVSRAEVVRNIVLRVLKPKR